MYCVALRASWQKFFAVKPFAVRPLSGDRLLSRGGIVVEIEGIGWEDDLAVALERAERERRFILADFSKER